MKENFHPQEMPEIKAKLLHIFKQAFGGFPEIDGAVFGGSYAQGKFHAGEDIDFDLLINGGLEERRKKLIITSIQRLFTVNGLTPEIRAFIDVHQIRRENPDQDYYDLHPKSPFIVRNEDIALLCGLER